MEFKFLTLLAAMLAVVAAAPQGVPAPLAERKPVSIVHLVHLLDGTLANECIANKCFSPLLVVLFSTSA
jgi:hypothetical protein